MRETSSIEPGEPLEFHLLLAQTTCSPRTLASLSASRPFSYLFPPCWMLSVQSFLSSANGSEASKVRVA